MLEGSPPLPRRSHRIYAKLPIRLEVGSPDTKVAHEAFTVDLSPLGARVRANIPLSQGQTVKVFSNEGPKYVIPSRVVWVRMADRDRDGEAGLEFLQALPAAA